MPEPIVFRRLTLLATSCLLAGTVAAREFWLEPARFEVAPGTALHLRVLMGENFRGTRWAGKAARVKQLLLATPTGLQDLTAAAKASDTLRTTLTFRQPGTHLVALATDNAFLTMEPQPFAAYLRAEGLEYVLALRKERGEAEKPADTPQTAGAPSSEMHCQ